MLKNRDYTIIIDKSGSMYTKDQAGGKSRWALMQESTIALANKCEELDPDGMTVYVFFGRFKRYDNVTVANSRANIPRKRTFGDYKFGCGTARRSEQLFSAQSIR